MSIFEFLEEMQNDIIYGNIISLNEKYCTLCQHLATEIDAEIIRMMDLEKYINRIQKAFKKTIQKAVNKKAKAIYFEYDMDNGWDSYFFICDEYNNLNKGDHDWVCSWVDKQKGPSLSKFTKIYETNGFDKNDKAIGITLYLIARTVSSLIKGCNVHSYNKPICIGFHDQDPVFRIKKYGKDQF